MTLSFWHKHYSLMFAVAFCAVIVIHIALAYPLLQAIIPLKNPPLLGEIAPFVTFLKQELTLSDGVLFYLPILILSLMLLPMVAIGHLYNSRLDAYILGLVLLLNPYHYKMLHWGYWSIEGLLPLAILSVWAFIAIAIRYKSPIIKKSALIVLSITVISLWLYHYNITPQEPLLSIYNEAQERPFFFHNTATSDHLIFFTMAVYLSGILGFYALCHLMAIIHSRYKSLKRYSQNLYRYTALGLMAFLAFWTFEYNSSLRDSVKSEHAKQQALIEITNHQATPSIIAPYSYHQAIEHYTPHKSMGRAMIKASVDDYILGKLLFSPAFYTAYASAYFSEQKPPIVRSLYTSSSLMSVERQIANRYNNRHNNKNRSPNKTIFFYWDNHLLERLEALHNRYYIDIYTGELVRNRIVVDKILKVNDRNFLFTRAKTKKIYQSARLAFDLNKGETKQYGGEDLPINTAFINDGKKIKKIIYPHHNPSPFVMILYKEQYLIFLEHSLLDSFFVQSYLLGNVDERFFSVGYREGGIMVLGLDK